MAFLKFLTDKEVVEKFINGKIRFGRVMNYRKNENNVIIGKQDEKEGDFFTTKYELLNHIPIKLTISFEREHDYALCLYRMRDVMDKESIERMKTFGKYIVYIEDEGIFSKRLYENVEKERLLIKGNDVFYYYDLSIEDEMKVMELVSQDAINESFLKRREFFAYQYEYRFVIVDNKSEGEYIECSVGDISDIAKVISVDDILKMHEHEGIRIAR